MKDIKGIIEILQLPEIEKHEDSKSPKTMRAYDKIILNILRPESTEKAMEYLDAIGKRLDALRLETREIVIDKAACHPGMPEYVRSAFSELNRWMSFYEYYSEYINIRLENMEIPEQIKLSAKNVKDKYSDLIAGYSMIPTAAFTLYTKLLEKGELALCGTLQEITGVYYLTMDRICNDINSNADAQSARSLESYYDEVNLRVCMKEERMIPPNAAIQILDYREYMKLDNDQKTIERYDCLQKEIEVYLAEENPYVKSYLALETEIFEKELERIYQLSKNKCFSAYGTWTAGNRYVVYRDDKKLRNEYIENTMRALHTNNQFGKTKLGVPYGIIRKTFTDSHA